MMRYELRKLFDAAISGVPACLLRGLFKTFVTRPDLAEQAGFQVYPKVFYSPLPDPDEVDIARLDKPRFLPGIDLNLESALILMGRLQAFSGELAQFPRTADGAAIEWSHTYPSLDTATLYTMLRHLKPRRYIEVGCGYSTRVSTAALLRNAEEGTSCESTFIEPFPASHFQRNSLPGKFLERRIQDVPLDLFRLLADGDVLFIDTSHVIKVQNDVEHELLRILPLLASGVHVHVHDIMTPYDYPQEWLVGRSPQRGGNNEQYALECLMSGGNDWQVTLPVHCLWRQYPQVMSQLLPGIHERPAAFWLRRNTAETCPDGFPLSRTSHQPASL